MLDIASLMRLWTGEEGFGNRTGRASEDLVFDVDAEDRSERAMVWLQRYVGKAWSLLVLLLPPSTTLAPAETDVIKPAAAMAVAVAEWTCLLCEKNGEAKTFSQRASLTRHIKLLHIAKGHFNDPFQCPQCRRDGLPITTISSAAEWGSHAESEHSLMCAPTSQSASPAPRKHGPSTEGDLHQAQERRRRRQGAHPRTPRLGHVGGEAAEERARAQGRSYFIVDEPYSSSVTYLGQHHQRHQQRQLDQR